MLVTCRQMQEAEACAFANGVSAAALMEQAGCGIARIVRQFFPVPGTARLYLGTGNNAGDALVAGRELRAAGWRLVGTRGGGTWSRPSRPRADTPDHLRGPKCLWRAPDGADKGKRPDAD